MRAPVYNLKFEGGFGNRLFQYAYARALCERDGLTLHTEPWAGQRIFQLNDPPTTDQPTWPGYCQRQEHLIYTRRQVQRWFCLRPEVEERLRFLPIPYACAHLRRGDYHTSGHVIVSEPSYYNAIKQLGLERECQRVCEDYPHTLPHFSTASPWLPDFYLLTRCRILLRANSTFSWWAATLGAHEAVYAPIIANHLPGLADCDFVPGNHPRMCNDANCTDLHLPP